jgi:uncharacterized protein (UPF0332 family)
VTKFRALLDKATTDRRSAQILAVASDFDSAASRRYYAVFYCARAALLATGRTYSKHQGVLSGFGAHLAKTGPLPWLAAEPGVELPYHPERKIDP